MEKKNNPAGQAAATYQPAPIDTAGVVLPESLLALTETIARNTHEAWARQRMDEGWRYGPSRDDVRKLHPNLVPYEYLSEEDKEYDRLTALNAIRLMVLSGFTVTAPDEAAAKLS